MQKKILCNQCGKELDFFDLQQDFSIHKHIQYGSEFDGCYVHYRLCCDCFDKCVKECEVNPIREVNEE